MMNKGHFILFLAVLSLALSGCGSAPAEKTAATTTPENKNIGNNGADTGVSASDIALFEEYLGAYERSQTLAEYAVSYDVKNLYEGEGTVQQSLYKKGSNERVDMTTSTLESRGLTTNEKSTSCMKEAGADWSCFEVANKKEALSGADAITVNVTTSEEEVKQEKVIFRKDGTIDIAGTTANCWRTERPSEKAIDRTCLSKEGILLYSRSEIDGKVTEIAATKYSLSVSDDVFTVPAGAKVETTKDLVADMGLACSDCELMPEESRADCLATCK